jgi:hypothetical protein
MEVKCMDLSFYYTQYLVRYTSPHIRRNKVVLAIVSFVLGWRMVHDWSNVTYIFLDLLGAIFVYLIVTGFVSSLVDIEDEVEEIEEENEEENEELEELENSEHDE